MQKSVQITSIIVVGVVLICLLGFFIFNSANQNTINVQGYSEIKAIPDLVVVYFNVETKGTTSSEATDKNSEIVEKLTENLVAEGFEKEKIQTQNFNVYPDYIWTGSQKKENGYLATHSLKVELVSEEIDRVGKIVDAGVYAGAGIGYINFELSVSSQNKYKAEAMKLAAQDATIKANAVAEGFGKRAGKLVSVSISEWGYSPWNIYSSKAGGIEEDYAEARQTATVILPSEQTITASVLAVFKIR